MSIQKLVNTHELKDGDVVLCHGVLFRLKNRKDWGVDEGFDPEKQGSCITFETDLLHYPEEGSVMPRGWVEGWVVQGNKLAKWVKVED